MKDDEFYHMMARWKILEAIAAETVPVDENPKSYTTFVPFKPPKKVTFTVVLPRNFQSIRRIIVPEK